MNASARDWRIDARDLANALSREGIHTEICEAIARVPRHLFVPDDLRDRAYEDSALPIGREQTISQPFVVASMTQFLAFSPGARILEIGTGSGYQAAVLSELGAEVYSIEIIDELSRRAADALKAAGYANVHLRVGDGASGWPEEAPFDGIIVTAVAHATPPALLQQLATGGRLVIPLESGPWAQWVWCVTKQAHREPVFEKLLAVRFVPMTGSVRDA